MASKILNLFDRSSRVDTSRSGSQTKPPPPPYWIADALRSGFVPPDGAFDRFLPYDLHVVSARHWTPLVVAAWVAEYLDHLGVRSVVDIGSGAGKFCVAAALMGHCRFTGLEQRARLVAAARELAKLFDVDDRVAFIHGALGEIPIPQADAYYLYNPFGENLFGARERIDEDVELGKVRYKRDIAMVEDLLRGAAAGTYLVVYNGFGGNVPGTFQELLIDREIPNELRIWRKAGGLHWTAGPLQSLTE